MRLAAPHDTAVSRTAPGRNRLRVAVPRLAVALAASSLLATTVAGPASASGATHRRTGPNYVSEGDSFTAGPLIPHLTGSPAGCARSTHNYPSLVAARAGAASFTDVSCQGADSTDMTQPQS